MPVAGSLRVDCYRWQDGKVYINNEQYFEGVPQSAWQFYIGMAKREWKKIEGFDFKEIIFEEYHHIAKITINRERYRNAFTPRTTLELSQAFAYCREAERIRVVLLTGAGDKAFCSGGDMHVKGRGGYVGSDGVPRLNVLDVQMQIRRLPKPVIAMVNGYAIGGGHVLHLVCDLTIASENAIFGQTGPKVGSFRRRLRLLLPGPHRGTEEGPRDMVPVPPVQRP